MPGDEDVTQPVDPDRPQPGDSDRARQRRRRWRRRLLIGVAIVGVIGLLVVGYYGQRSLRYRANVRANRDLGYAALAAGKYDEALRLVRPYARSYVDDLDAMWAVARSREEVEAAGQSHLGTAAAGYARLLERAPSSPNAEQAELRLLNVLYELRQWRQIVEQTERVRPEPPGDAADELELSRLFARGVALAGVDREAEAIEFLDVYLSARPLDSDAAILRAALDAKTNAGAAVPPEPTSDHPSDLTVRSARLALAGDAEAAATAAEEAADGVTAAFLTESADKLGVLSGRARFVNRLVAALDLANRPTLATDVAKRAAEATGDVRWSRLVASRLTFAEDYAGVIEATQDVAVESGDGLLLGLRALALIELDRSEEAGEIRSALAGRPADSIGAAWSTILPHWRPSAELLFDLPSSDLPPAFDRFSAAQLAVEAYPHAVFSQILGEALLEIDEPEAAEAQLLRTAAGTRPVWSRSVFAAALASVRLQESAAAVERLTVAQGTSSRPTMYAAAATWLLSENGARAADDGRAQAGDQLAATSDPYEQFRLAVVAGRPDLLDPAALPPELLPATLSLSLQEEAEATAQAVVNQAAADDTPVAALLRARQSAHAGDATTLRQLASNGSGRLALAAWNDLAAVDPSAAADLLRAAFEADDARVWDQAVSSNVLDPANAADWSQLRAAAQRQADLLKMAGLRSRVRLAALDVNPPSREPDAAALREQALQLGTLARAWPRVPAVHLALVAVLDELDLENEATRRLTEAADPSDAPLELQLALADRLLRNNARSSEARRVLRRAQTAATTNSQRVRPRMLQSLVDLLVRAGLEDEAAALVPAPSDDALASASAGEVSRWRRLGLLDGRDLSALAQSEDPDVLAVAFDVLYARKELDAAARVADAVAEQGDPLVVAEAERLRALLDAARGDRAGALDRLSRLTADPASSEAAWVTRLELMLRSEGAAATVPVAEEAASRAAEGDKERFALFARFARAPRADATVGLMLDLLAADAETIPLIAQLADLTIEGKQLSREELRSLVSDLDTAAGRQPWLESIDLITAQLALRLGDNENAAARADALLARRPNDPAVARVAVDALAAAGRTDGALAAARRWREFAAPNDRPAANAALGRLYLRNNEATRALRSVEPDIDADEPATRLAAREVAALAYLELGQAERALSMLLPLVEDETIGVDSPLVWQIATAAGAAGSAQASAVFEDAEQAMRSNDSFTWQRALLLAESWVNVWQARDDAAPDADSREAALRLLNATRETLLASGDATASTWQRIGGRFGQLEDHDRARDAYERALALDPDAYLAANNLAMLLVRPESPNIADAERAESLVLRILANPAVRDDANFAAIVDTQATVEWKRGQRDAALRRLEQLVALSPDEPEWRIHLAELLLQSDREDDAREQLRRVDDLFGRDDFPRPLKQRLDRLRAEL